MSVKSRHLRVLRSFTTRECGSEREASRVFESCTSMPELTRLIDVRARSRACPELNESHGDRCAILNSVLPSWIQPMSPRQEGALQQSLSQARPPSVKQSNSVFWQARPDSKAP